MNNNLITILLYMLSAIGSFIMFANDIEEGRDFWTWIYLLSSIMFFVLSILTLLLEVIKEVRESNK